MVKLPRLVIAAPATGQGKTTVATGLMSALRATGRTVSGHKIGPDYIDPGYHALATGRPGRNLDPNLVNPERIMPLLQHGASGAAIAVIEGVMGLHDGKIGTGGFGSTAHVAALTQSPVILVTDVARQSRSAAAIAAGVAAFDPRVNVAGIILNRAGSARNVTEISRAMEDAGLPVLGVLPNDDEISAPSRHLGLVPAAEREASASMIVRLGEQVARHLDLDALLDVAASAPDLTGETWDPEAEIGPGPWIGSGDRPVVAVAGGRAFTFRYAEVSELLQAAGCDVVAFDPLTDEALPAGTRGIYLGGGFPEVYTAELAANESLLRDLRDAVTSGVPTVAECAGLLYLARTLDGASMAGVIPADAVMTKRLTLRYPSATAVAGSLLTRAGEAVTGHEFHRTRIDPAAGERPAWELDGEAAGFASDTWHASYLHVHWAGYPHLARRFATAVHAFGAVPAPAVDPLRHHGDAETGEDLLDFAVNVYSGDRPSWLDDALHEAIDRSRAYPDAAPARDAIARFHGRDAAEVLATSGAAEAFTLIARARPWRNPVVVHPQFTEPHAALDQAGHTVTSVLCRAAEGFVLDPDAVPADAGLVIVGNPTNPTGVLHPDSAVRKLLRPGRLVVVDEAFMDAVPDEPESLAGEPLEGLLVIRSLTKHWSIPGIRAGYVAGDPSVIAELEAIQTPWSVSAPAIAATIACTSAEATAEARERAVTIGRWRDHLETGLRERGVEYVPSAASFVLARLGDGTREALRVRGVAVRRCDTFPGLNAAWARIAVRPPDLTDRLLSVLDEVRRP